MAALNLHRGPYGVTGRRCLRAEWAPGGELAIEVESDLGNRTINLSEKQVDRLVAFLLEPYVVTSTAEEVIPMGKSGKGRC